MNLLYNALIDETKNDFQDITDVSCLTGTTWTQIDDSGFTKTKYIFKNYDNELIVSNQGDVNIIKWEFLTAVKAVLIHDEKASHLYSKAFVSKDVIILKKDSSEEYLVLVSQQKSHELENGKSNLEFINNDRTESEDDSKNISVQTHNLKKNYSARKEKEAMHFGFLMLILWVILLVIMYDFGTPDASVIRIMTTISFVIRFISIVWIIGIAGRLKRSKLGWGLFAFFFPAIALIIIGNLSNK